MTNSDAYCPSTYGLGKNSYTLPTALKIIEHTIQKKNIDTRKILEYFNNYYIKFMNSNYKNCSHYYLNHHHDESSDDNAA